MQQKEKPEPLSVAGGRVVSAGRKVAALHDVPVTTSQARVAALINADGTLPAGDLLFSVRADERHQLASLVKILTAMVLLDSQPPPDMLLTRTSADAATGSGANLAEGDSLSLRDAVYNLMLPSSNVTANMIARIFGGQLLLAEGITDFSPVQAVSRWVAQMNHKAQALGMLSARFTTPSGLGKNIASARDALKMVAAATRYPLIMQSWGTQTYRIRVSGAAVRTPRITNTNDLLFSDPSVIGGKTGTLTPLFNLVCLAQLPDRQRVVVVALGAASKGDRAADCRAMLAAIQAQYGGHAP